MTKKKKPALNLNIYINEEKRTVVVKVTNVFKVLDNIISELNLDDIMMCGLDSKITIKDEYIGKAKCSLEDNFDLELGIHLASARARVKCYAGIGKALTLIREHLADLAETVRKVEDNYYDIVYLMDSSTRELSENI